jgi:hypothetical protein
MTFVLLVLKKRGNSCSVGLEFRVFLQYRLRDGRAAISVVAVTPGREFMKYPG